MFKNIKVLYFELKYGLLFMYYTKCVSILKMIYMLNNIKKIFFFLLGINFIHIFACVLYGCTAQKGEIDIRVGCV